MKKYGRSKTLFMFILMLITLVLFSAAAFAASTEQTDTPITTEDILLSIGDTAQGSSCSITVTSVECVDKIENGYKHYIFYPGTKLSYEDVTAEDGYRIIKISYHIDYTGKKTGAVKLHFALNYDDGYIFEGHGGHALPYIDNSVLKYGFEETYVFGQTYFVIDDPLEFQETDAFVYIFVNEAVMTNTDKTFVLEVSIPATAYDESVYADYGFFGEAISTEAPEYEKYVYNLR